MRVGVAGYDGEYGGKTKLDGVNCEIDQDTQNEMPFCVGTVGNTVVLSDIELVNLSCCCKAFPTGRIMVGSRICDSVWLRAFVAADIIGCSNRTSATSADCRLRRCSNASVFVLFRDELYREGRPSVTNGVNRRMGQTAVSSTDIVTLTNQLATLNRNYKESRRAILPTTQYMTSKIPLAIAGGVGV